MRAVVFREGPWLVGQCIERDIAVQSKTLSGIKKEFRGMLDAYRQLRALHKLPRPPAHIVRRPGRTIYI